MVKPQCKAHGVAPGAPAHLRSGGGHGPCHKWGLEPVSNIFNEIQWIVFSPSGREASKTKVWKLSRILNMLPIEGGIRSPQNRVAAIGNALIDEVLKL